jgi:anti-sigma B factor antagonist
MKWNERRIDGVVIIDLKGKLTLGAGDVLLRQVVRDALGRGEKAIVLNLGSVGYMDSAGVGELVASYTTAQASGADLKLLNLTAKIRDLLQFTQLISVFDSYTDEQEAVASFGS